MDKILNFDKSKQIDCYKILGCDKQSTVKSLNNNENETIKPRSEPPPPPTSFCWNQKKNFAALFSLSKFGRSTNWKHCNCTPTKPKQRMATTSSQNYKEQRKSWPTRNSDNPTTSGAKVESQFPFKIGLQIETHHWWYIPSSPLNRPSNFNPKYSIGY